MRAKQLQVRNSDKLRIAPTTEWQPACVPCTEEARSFHSAYLVYHDVVQRDWLSGLLRSCCCTMLSAAMSCHVCWASSRRQLQLIVLVHGNRLLCWRIRNSHILRLPAFAAQQPNLPHHPCTPSTLFTLCAGFYRLALISSLSLFRSLSAFPSSQAFRHLHCIYRWLCPS